MNWKDALQTTHTNIEAISAAIADLTKYRDEATANIAQYLRATEKGIELDVDAIRATLTRPYTLLPINEHESWLIHWRGVKMPIFGWVVAQEPAFLKARVTRSMDLLTPLPPWMKDELGWKPPEHSAIIDGTRTSLRLNEGDESSFRRKYGQHLGKKQADGSYAIKGGDAWIKLVAELVRDGILPYAPTPVAAKHWEEKARAPEALMEIVRKKQKEAGADYIERAVQEFVMKGAVLVNYPPGSGKTLTTLLILNHFRGKVLLLADTTMLIEQWKDRLKTFAPHSDVTVSTYQGAQKYLKERWDLIVPDEAQRLPANTFSKLAFVQTTYRLGLTGTPWREDDRQHLIVALSGFPVAIRWSEMIRAGALRKPRIVVATVSSETAKTAYVRTLVSARKGRTMIFCDWLEQGKALADALEVPFVHGGTARKLQTLEENEVCVVSRVGDRGISLRDLRLVIEVAGAGSAREQFAQRVGRLLHGDFNGEFVTVFTPEEAAKYRGRVFGVEAELAGEVEIEFVEVGSTFQVSSSKSHALRLNSLKGRTAKRVVRERITSNDVNSRIKKPMDETAEVLSLPAVAAKIELAKKSVGQDAVQYVERVLRYCWESSLSPKDIVDGLGMTGKNSLSRLSSACKAAVKVGLMVSDEHGRYRVNQDEIHRLKVLSGLRK
jgi:DNA excision repair protein ERCC-3